MKRLLVLVSTLCLIALSAAASPEGPRLGLPQAGIEGDPGDTVVSWRSEDGGVWTISRAVSSWCEISASTSRDRLFSLSGRFVLSRFFYPLVVGTAIDLDSVAFLSSVHLGPVRLDAARSWGAEPQRTATLRLSAVPVLAMVIGIEKADGRADVLAGVELHRELWGISFVVARSGWRIECAGVLR